MMALLCSQSDEAMNTEQTQLNTVREWVLDILKSDDCEDCQHWDYDGRAWACYAKAAGKCAKIDQILDILVVLDPDQTPPPELASCGYGCEELLKNWRKMVL